MIVTSAQEFRETMLSFLEFQKESEPYFTKYTNLSHPEYGYYLFYERKEYYEFGIADYTIQKDFSLSFDNPQKLIRFGIVSKGTTHFKIKDAPVSSFSPSSFFVIEENISGKQSWKKGQHFHGIEVTIYENFIHEIIEPISGEPFPYDAFCLNATYRYLPLEIVHILQEMQTFSDKNQLSPLYLAGKMIESIAILLKEINDRQNNCFATQLEYADFSIGSGKKVHLSSEDIQSIKQAHKILTNSFSSPPTIEALSQQILLSQQKLKAGFSHIYHMSIGEYVTSLRMSLAANLLCTTELSVGEIAKEAGYEYPANFIKMFKKTYGKTPFQFRRHGK